MSLNNLRIRCISEVIVAVVHAEAYNQITEVYIFCIEIRFLRWQKSNKSKSNTAVTTIRARLVKYRVS